VMPPGPIEEEAKRVIEKGARGKVIEPGLGEFEAPGETVPSPAEQAIEDEETANQTRPDQHPGDKERDPAR
jgi:hypothetical protein